VIDQPQLIVRPEQIRIPDRAIEVLNQAVEPDDPRREFRIHLQHIHRREASGVRQELESEISTDAPVKQLHQFVVSILRTDRRRNVDENTSGNGQFQCIGQFPNDDFGYETGRRLTGSAKLGVEHARVGFD
jgi:hypothetical protein